MPTMRDLIRLVEGRATKQPASTDVASPEFQAWFGASRVVDASGAPLVVHHGTNQTFDTFVKKRGGMATGVRAGARHGFFFTNSRAEAADYAKHAGTKVVANIAKHEKESRRLQREQERLEQIANRTNRNEDWSAYERAQEAWSNFEISAIQQDDSNNLQIVSAYLSLQHPLEVNFDGMAGGNSEHGDIEAVVATALRQGYDGVIMRNIYDGPYGGHTSDHYVAFSAKQIRRVQ